MAKADMSESDKVYAGLTRVSVTLSNRCRIVLINASAFKCFRSFRALSDIYAYPYENCPTVSEVCERLPLIVQVSLAFRKGRELLLLFHSSTTPPTTTAPIARPSILPYGLMIAMAIAFSSAGMRFSIASL